MKTLKFISLLCISLSFLSCKKMSKEETTVNFHLYNPATNEPFVGVVVKVYQQEDVSPKFGAFSDDKYENTVIWEGKTDANGKASHTFKTQKKAKFTYWQYVDESFTTGLKIIDQPSYGNLNKETVNKIEYAVVRDNIPMIIWLKNVNCFDASDKFKFRERSLVILGKKDWSVWKPNFPSIYPSNYYEGCYEAITENIIYTHQDIIEFEYEIIRNGIVSHVRDTIQILGYNLVDTMKLHY